MPAFKPKNIKKIIISKKNITTLDGKHKEIIDSFYNDKEEQLPILREEKNKWYVYSDFFSGYGFTHNIAVVFCHCELNLKTFVSNWWIIFPLLHQYLQQLHLHRPLF